MATANVQPSQRVRFEWNEPVECALKYAGGGRIVSSQYSESGQEVMFTLVDGRRMYLDLGPAQRIDELRLNVRETFFICKSRRDGKTTWRVWLTPETELARAIAQSRKPLDQQLQESLDMRNVVVPAQPATGVVAPAASATAPVRAPFGTSPANVPQSSGLVEEANRLVDAYASVLARALEMYQGRIKPEEVKGILLSAYIQRGKAAGHV